MNCSGDWWCSQGAPSPVVVRRMKWRKHSCLRGGAPCATLGDRQECLYHTRPQWTFPLRRVRLSCRFRLFLPVQPALAELQDALGDMFGAEAELLHQFPWLAGEAETVLDSDHIEQ